MKKVLELAGNMARDMSRKRISTRHVLLAVRGDLEFDIVSEYRQKGSGYNTIKDQADN